MKKIYVDANDIMNDSFELAKKMHKSGYIPDDIIGVLEGGLIPAFYIKQYFDLMEKNIKEYLIPTKKEKSVNLKMIGLIQSEINKDIKSKRNILLVDDIIRTGHTLENIIKNLKSNMKEIKIATIYYNLENHNAKVKPDFYLHGYKKEDFVIFPYKLKELGLEDIKQINNNLYNILTT